MGASLELEPFNCVLTMVLKTLAAMVRMVWIVNFMLLYYLAVRMMRVNRISVYDV
jgi:hypothetical protein